MRQAGVAPILISQENVIKKNLSGIQRSAINKLKTLQSDLQKNQMPELFGMSLRSALQELRGRSGKIQIRGRGRVLETAPPSGATLSENEVVILRLGETL